MRNINHLCGLEEVKECDWKREVFHFLEHLTGMVVI